MASARSSVNRRDLLRGLGPRRPRPATALRAPTGDEPGRFDLLNVRRDGMGSFFEIKLPARAPGAVDLAMRALDIVDALELQMTIYRDDSELADINARAHTGPIRVEPGLFDLLARAVRISEQTGGAYDPTSGALSLAWGFTRGPRKVPEPRTLADALCRTGIAHVLLDADSRTVAFDRPGIVFNLGSIGKGHAVDRAAAVIRDHWWPTPALIHGGGSSLYALGSPPDTLGGRWEVALRNPFDPSRPIGTIRLRNRGLGTSGAAFQRFEAAGRVYGHIIDPRTGYPPADGPASVTVLAPTAAEADALSTAFYLSGPVGARSYGRRNPKTAALFVLPPADASDRPGVVAIGLSADDFEIEPSVAELIPADPRASSRPDAPPRA